MILSASVNATGASGYTASSATYARLTPTTTAAGPAGDDVVTATKLPFAFSFYGVSYSSVNISTNGNIQFGGNSNVWVASPIPTATVPNNYIALSWNDWNTLVSGTITSFTTGTAPNRRFVVSYNNVGSYSGGGTLTGQIMLFETSNFVELHLGTQNNTTYTKVQGIENATGSDGVAVTGRNNTAWTASNNAWRFTPISTANYAWSPATGLNTITGSNVTASPSTTTIYTVTATSNTGCQTTATQTVTVATESLWTGNTSTDWYDATNWIGCVPSSTIDGRIPAGRTNYPSVTAGTTAVVRTLTIENGGALNMNTATLRVVGNFRNLNPTAMTMTGTFQLEGNSPVLSNIGTVNNLTLALTSGTVTLPQALTVNTALTLTNGLLNTGAFALTLAPTATLTETETHYVIGTVVTTRPLVPGTANTFGGLGLTLTPALLSTAPGSTSVTRVTGTRLTGVSTNQSVQRYFIIHPTTNASLNVNMLFSYWIHELNAVTDALNLRLFRSVDGASGPWQPYGQHGINTVSNTVAHNNIAAFSTWTLGTSTNALPVELVAFTAERNGADAQLRWTTASEKNSDRFEVESSADGSRFTLIGTRAGQGTSTTPATYELLDANVARYAQPVAYYRLRQVDQAGTISYSAVRTVQVAPTANLSLLALPIPFDQYLTIRVTTLTAGPATLRFTDALGRQLPDQAVNLQAGTHDLLLPDAAKLSSGVYLLQVTQGAMRCTIKVVRC